MNVGDAVLPRATVLHGPNCALRNVRIDPCIQALQCAWDSSEFARSARYRTFEMTFRSFTDLALISVTVTRR